MGEEDIRKALSKDYKAGQIKETLSHHSVILGKDATPGDKIKHLHELAETHKVHKGGKRAPKLQKYIRKCYGHGYSREMIKDALREKGWPDEAVQRAFDLLK